jgi:hypothetical protein
MAMDQFLAQLYGTNKTASAQAQPPAPTQADIEKQAHVDLFIKTATEQGIDLQALPQDKVAELFDAFTTNLRKTASAAPRPMDVDAIARQEYEKTAAAQAEFQEKFAEWDYAGRVMAHAYVQELGNIAKTAGEMPPQFAAAAAAKKDGDKDEEKDEEKGKDKEKDKEASAPAPAPSIQVGALDKAAASYALAMVEEHNKTAGANGFDLATCEQKLSAVLVLGPRPSEKIASAQNYEQARHVRALELLEMAGYPVSWG